MLKEPTIATNFGETLPRPQENPETPAPTQQLLYETRAKLTFLNSTESGPKSAQARRTFQASELRLARQIFLVRQWWCRRLRRRPFTLTSPCNQLPFAEYGRGCKHIANCLRRHAGAHLNPARPHPNDKRSNPYAAAIDVAAIAWKAEWPEYEPHLSALPLSQHNGGFDVAPKADVCEGFPVAVKLASRCDVFRATQAN